MSIYGFVFLLICSFLNLHIGEGACCFGCNFVFCYYFTHHFLLVYRPWTVHGPHRLGNTTWDVLAFSKHLLYLCILSSIFKSKPLPFSLSMLLLWTQGPVNTIYAIIGRYLTGITKSDLLQYITALRFSCWSYRLFSIICRHTCIYTPLPAQNYHFQTL